MSQTFDKAPLVEIIVEGRWTPHVSMDQPGLPQGLMLPGAPHIEEFYMRFGVKAHLKGFQHVERLVPAGFPSPIGNVVYRYRQGVGDQAEKSKTEIWQVGPGIFAANATPPYRSWDKFEPVVREGFLALLASRSASEFQKPFSMVTLRYIDAFGASFLGGKTIEEFVKDVLGFKVVLPDALNEQVDPASMSANFQLSFQLPNKLIMVISLSKGNFGGEEVLMMDTLVRSAGEVAPDIESVMNVLGNSRKIIHDTFFGLTKKMHAMMGLKED